MYRDTVHKAKEGKVGRRERLKTFGGKRDATANSAVTCLDGPRSTPRCIHDRYRGRGYSRNDGRCPPICR